MPSALLNSLARSNTLLLLLLRSAFFGGGAPPGAAPAGQMMGVEIKAPLTFRTFRTFKAKRSALQENSRHSGRSEHSRQKTLPYKKVQGILLSRNPKAICRTRKPMALWPFRTFTSKHSAVQEDPRHSAVKDIKNILPCNTPLPILPSTTPAAHLKLRRLRRSQQWQPPWPPPLHGLLVWVD